MGEKSFFSEKSPFLRKVLFLTSYDRIDKMTKNRSITVDEDLYEEFKKDVRRVYGKVHGNMSKAIEDAITVYMRVGLTRITNLPPLRRYLCSEGGSSSHPKNQDQIMNFLRISRNVFMGIAGFILRS